MKKSFVLLTLILFIGILFPIPKINVAHADLQFLVKFKGEIEQELQQIDLQLEAYNASTASPTERERISRLAEYADRRQETLDTIIRQIAEIQSNQARQQQEAVVKPCEERDETTGVCLNNPFTGKQEGLVPKQILGRIIQFLLGIVGSIALLFFVVGGFQWMTAGGNAEQIKKAKGTLLWATLGLAVILGSYIILSNVITTLTESVGIQ